MFFHMFRVAAERRESLLPSPSCPDMHIYQRRAVRKVSGESISSGRESSRGNTCSRNLSEWVSSALRRPLSARLSTPATGKAGRGCSSANVPFGKSIRVSSYSLYRRPSILPSQEPHPIHRARVPRTVTVPLPLRRVGWQAELLPLETQRQACGRHLPTPDPLLRPVTYQHTIRRLHYNTP